MLDTFEILSTSGVVLWSKSYAPVNSSIINGLIADVFVEERVTPAPSGEGARNPQYKKDQYTLKWKTVKDLGLIFIVSRSSYHSALPLIASRRLQVSHRVRRYINRYFIFPGSMNSWTK
jgi:hypothetical protein